jgi:hypothetical protein
VPDDATAAVHESAEEDVIEIINSRAWERLAKDGDPIKRQSSRLSQRRWMYRGVNRIRAAFPRGDL